jgi:hypothetical protein
MDILWTYLENKKQLHLTNISSILKSENVWKQMETHVEQLTLHNFKRFQIQELNSSSRFAGNSPHTIHRGTTHRV